MNQKNKISILVAIYNVAPYIRQCIDSVLSQTYENWELILVDDGSNDDCPLICNEYVEIDKRISVVHKTNGGLASARNVGLAHATGDWIMMLDGDDWLSSNALELCIKEHERTNADYIKFSYYMEYVGRSFLHTYPLLPTKEDYIKQMLSHSIATSIWGGIYHKSLFETLSPRFTNGLNFGEDYSVSPRLLYLSKKAVFSQQGIYHYRILKKSYVGSYRWDNVEQIIECEKINFSFFRELDHSEYYASLLVGRGWTRALAFDYIFANTKANSKYLYSIQHLYGDEIDNSKVSTYMKLLINIATTPRRLSLVHFIFITKKIIGTLIKRKA